MSEDKPTHYKNLQPDHLPVPIVAIGGSAGGQQALTQLLQNLPGDTGLAYVYIGGQADDFPYLGKFIFRCLQICDLDDWELLKSQKVLVNIVDNVAVSIGTLSGSYFFNPP